MRSQVVWASVFLVVPLLVGRADRLKAEEAAFPLDEVSVFDSAAIGPSASELTVGARATTQDEPFEAVKAYPKLHSKKPIYGLIRLAPEPYKQESGTPLYFVVDESGEATAEEEPEEEEPEAADEPSLLEKLSSALLGTERDAPEKPDTEPKLNNTYDRLYIDLDGDLDLTNDPVVTPMKSPPTEAIQRYSSVRQCVVFDEIAVPLDFGPELGSRPVRLVPRATVQEFQEKEYRGASFISAVARVGNIKLGEQSYTAVLGQRYLISGRYDVPYTALLLTSPENPNRREYWWGSDRISAMRLVDGQYYTTSATLLGDKLIVRPYDGDYGILKIGPGKRDLDKLTIQGSLESKGVGLAVGEPQEGSSGSLEPVGECRLPVGDYLPEFVTIEFGTLRLSLSQNYHVDGEPRGAKPDDWVYGIKIRKDEPFVWDFSAPPDVMFASPAKDQTYKPGDEISVKAVLVDPPLGAMIRRLNDVERTEKKTIELGEGRTTSVEQQASLDPVVTITDSSGKQVAEGPMPFG